MDKGGIVQMAKLVAFYSRADENYFGGSMKYIQIGNTEKAAKMIADMTGADLFKIEQKIPYAADYNTCIAQAKEDKQTGKRPEILNLPQDIDQYDEIYLGYPNYWGTMPMAVYTFLESYDFTGKKRVGNKVGNCTSVYSGGSTSIFHTERTSCNFRQIWN